MIFFLQKPKNVNDDRVRRVFYLYHFVFCILAPSNHFLKWCRSINTLEKNMWFLHTINFVWTGQILTCKGGFFLDLFFFGPKSGFLEKKTIMRWMCLLKTGYGITILIICLFWSFFFRIEQFIPCFVKSHICQKMIKNIKNIIKQLYIFSTFCHFCHFWEKKVKNISLEENWKISINLCNALKSQFIKLFIWDIFRKWGQKIYIFLYVWN